MSEKSFDPITSKFYIRSIFNLPIFSLTLLFLLTGISFTIRAQEEQPPKKDQKAVNISSHILREQRTLWIYTPRDYNTSNEKYPVMYLLDPDQNFAYVTELERFLSDRYRMPQMIVVGIVNNDRKKDFTPIHSLIFDGKIDSSLATTGGGKDFLSFVKTELIPYIDTNYRTQDYRILSGHSLGGLFALYAKKEEPTLFHSEILISPAIYGRNIEILSTLSEFFKKYSNISGYMSLSLGDEPGGRLAVDSIVSQLKQYAPTSFKWQYNTYPNEDHFSVGYKSMYDGLRFIYKDWFLNPLDTSEVKSYQDIHRHFQNLSKLYGYQIKPSEDFLNDAGYQRLGSEHTDQAIEIFTQNVRSHPNSSNAYDSLAEAYFTKGNYKMALENYKKSVSLNQDNENGKTMIKKITDQLALK